VQVTKHLDGPPGTVKVHQFRSECGLSVVCPRPTWARHDGRRRQCRKLQDKDRTRASLSNRRVRGFQATFNPLRGGNGVLTRTSSGNSETPRIGL
jgi:hypothetical protein